MFLTPAEEQIAAMEILRSDPDRRRKSLSKCIPAVFYRHLCMSRQLLFFWVIVSLVPAIQGSECQDVFFCLGHVSSAHERCSEGEREHSCRRKVPPALQIHHASIPLLLLLQPCAHQRSIHSLAGERRYCLGQIVNL